VILRAPIEWPHEFVPFPVTADDKPGHVCTGGCFCSICGLQKRDRTAHYQARDRRRPKAAAS
jgi:hypothetical protein